VNLRDFDFQVERIRGIQARFALAHAALTNWGAWSRDRYNIGPKDSRTKVFEQYVHDETEAYGEVEQGEATRAADIAPELRKAEFDDPEPHDEKAGAILDERLHSNSGLCADIRRIIRVAYVTREVPENQFHRLSGCSEDAFCERLEVALQFVRRFS
jgi:hypothetical protein